MNSDLIERLHKLHAIHGYESVREAIDRIEQLEEVVEASKKLQADMIMRADIGTYDGDHSVQAGATVWRVFCETLAKLDKGE